MWFNGVEWITTVNRCICFDSNERTNYAVNELWDIQLNNNNNNNNKHREDFHSNCTSQIIPITNEPIFYDYNLSIGELMTDNNKQLQMV